MLDKRAAQSVTARSSPPLDFQEHLRRLEAEGLLHRIDRAIDKDSELHPLVRWQFQGGLREDERRAFLFTNVTDGGGRRYDIPVAVGALAASPRASADASRKYMTAAREMFRQSESIIDEARRREGDLGQNENWARDIAAEIAKCDKALGK
jgi:3-polyprenyl-4-hydroxybenzoate decarboxylase